jgi:hypothetical protein
MEGEHKKMRKMMMFLMLVILLSGTNSVYGGPGESVTYYPRDIYLYMGTEEDVEKKMNSFIDYIALANKVEEYSPSSRGSYFRNFKTTYYIRKNLMINQLFEMDIEILTYKKIFQRLGKERTYEIGLSFSYFPPNNNVQTYQEIENMVVEFEDYAERNDWMLEKTRIR